MSAEKLSINRNITTAVEFTSLYYKDSYLGQPLNSSEKRVFRTIAIRNYLEAKQKLNGHSSIDKEYLDILNVLNKEFTKPEDKKIIKKISHR